MDEVIQPQQFVTWFEKGKGMIANSIYPYWGKDIIHHIIKDKKKKKKTVHKKLRLKRYVPHDNSKYGDISRLWLVINEERRTGLLALKIKYICVTDFHHS